MPRYGDDNYQELILRQRELGSAEFGALPRRSVYGSAEAAALGLTPIHEAPSPLVPKSEWQAVIEECHAKKIFPMYHLKASGLVSGGSWTQNGFNYCWSWGATLCLMTRRAVEGQPPKLLNPLTNGYLVRYRNVGFFLDETIAGLGERGVASVEAAPATSLRDVERTESQWRPDGLNYRVSKVFDTNRADGEEAMISQALTILRMGDPGYIAHNWWSHALTCMGMNWDPKERNSIVWLDWNSHADGLIELTGTKGVPDEFYGFAAASFPGTVAV